MTGKPLVFLEISIDGVEVPGRILLELFDKEAPMTAANFRKLCTGGHYKGSSFHRAIPNNMCCGGDFIHGNGTGVGSIYGDKFPVVERSDPHWPNKLGSYKGLLITGHAVPDKAPYTCGPKFILTTSLNPAWLVDTHHTIFGGIVGGGDIVKSIQDAGTVSGIIPKEKKVLIYNCGELRSGSVWGAAPGQSSPSIRAPPPRQSSPSVRTSAAPRQSSPSSGSSAHPRQISPSVKGAAPRRR